MVLECQHGWSVGGQQFEESGNMLADATLASAYGTVNMSRSNIW